MTDIGTLQELEVRIYARLDDLEKNLRSATSMTERAGKQMGEKIDLSAKSIGQSLTRNVTIPLAAAGAAMLAFGAKSFQAAARMDTLERSMGAIMGSSIKARIEIANLQKVAMLPGIGFEAALEGSQRLQSVGLAADKARGLLVQMANANALVGGTSENLQGALLQLSQTLGSGFLQGDELRIIAERIPVFRRALADAFGTSNSEIIGKMMKDGELSMDAFIDGLTRGLANMPRAEAGIQTQLDKIKDTIFRAMADSGKELIPIVESILPDLIAAMKELLPVGQSMAITFREMAPAIKTLIETMAGMARRFTDLPPSMQLTIVKSLAYLAVLGPLISGVGKLSSGIKVLSQVMAGLRGVQVATTGMTFLGREIATTAAGATRFGALARLMPALMNPYVLAVAAAAAAVIGLKVAYDRTLSAGERHAANMKQIVAQMDAHDVAANKSAQEVRKLVDEYADLHAKTKPTADESVRMQDVLNKISVLSPGLVTGFDNQGNALGLLATAYKTAADEAERLARASHVAEMRPLADEVGRLAERRAALTDELSLTKEIAAFRARFNASGDIGPFDNKGDARAWLDATGVRRDAKIVESEIASVTRNITEANKKLLAAGDAFKNPPTATGTGAATFTPKGDSDAAKELKRQLKDLEDQAYSLARAMAIGDDASVSASMAFDLVNGKVAEGAKAMHGEVMWLQMVKEHLDKTAEAEKKHGEEIRKKNAETAEANRSARKRLADLALERSILAATTKEERDRLEMMGAWKDLVATGVDPILALLIVTQQKHNEAVRESNALASKAYDAAKLRQQAAVDEIGSLMGQLKVAQAVTDVDKKRVELSLEMAASIRSGLLPQLALMNAALKMKIFLTEREQALAEKQVEGTTRYNDAILRLRERMAAASSAGESMRFTINALAKSFTNPGEGLAAGLQRAREYMDELFRVERAEEWKNMIVGMTKSIEDAFVEMAQNILTDGFGNMFKNIYQGFRKMLADMALEYLHFQIRTAIRNGINNIIGNIFGAAVGGGGGVTGGGDGSSGSIGQTQVGRAVGGPVEPGRAFYVGENGPEMFVPSVGGNIVSNADMRNITETRGGQSDSRRYASSLGQSGVTNLTFNFSFPGVTNVDGVKASKTQIAMEYAREIARVSRRTS